MLGFGKKKDKDAGKDVKKKADKENTDKTENEAAADNKSAENSDQETPPKEKKDKKSKGKIKKLLSVKRVLIIAFILCIGVGGFVVYSLYFGSGSNSDSKPVYKKMALEHVDLPEEMLKFTFNFFPDLYDKMITANTEINIINDEIQRIEAVSEKYPDQAKIAEKEKKLWVKTRDGLQKSFSKIEKPVKETYVLFQVNEPAGLAKIKELKSQLPQTAEDALIPVQELTKRIKPENTIPEGFIQGTIYKLKKKFL